MARYFSPIWIAIFVLAIPGLTGCSDSSPRQVEETSEYSFDDVAERLQAEEDDSSEKQDGD
ncbi:hypothetical protein [Stieleria varia]|uniref:Uncharacterized protein n=1 Tax=Stieleria varia TaxID=2528005 RepID=A0A5C6AX81_9BACT|nr:hypothetical protein [Stieleria varia]TWU04340.1 hypothetical protein Pla52n_23800 [Stieleria varia]